MMTPNFGPKKWFVQFKVRFPDLYHKETLSFSTVLWLNALVFPLATLPRVNFRLVFQRSSLGWKEFSADGAHTSV